VPYEPLLGGLEDSVGKVDSRKNESSVLLFIESLCASLACPLNTNSRLNGILNDVKQTKWGLVRGAVLCSFIDWFLLLVACLVSVVSRVSCELHISISLV